ncbi:MAG TPA: YcxB family protein, partial [Clostridia bacterium]|nr:YcxB family protein [Clostridia bacterium]
ISAASIVCVATYPIGIYYHAKKHFKNSKLYHETHEYIVNNEGIELKLETASTKVKWSAIIRIIELNSVFIIMAPNNNTYAILKRYFADESEIKVFVAMIKKNVNAKKLKLKR